MPGRPKLRVQSTLEENDEAHIIDLEQAREQLSYSAEKIVLLEGQAVHSYDDLVKLATSDQFKGKELLEVKVLPFIEGG